MPRRSLDVDVLYKRLRAIENLSGTTASARYPDNPARRWEMEASILRDMVHSLSQEIRPHTSDGQAVLDQLITDYPDIDWDRRRGFFLGTIPPDMPPADVDALANALHLAQDNHTVASGRVWTGRYHDDWKVSLRQPAHEIAC